MATFTWAPDWGTQQNRKPRVKVASFGDGYQQRVADGINTNPKNWTVAFNARTDTEAGQIMAFLDLRAGVEAFDWTDPDGVAGKYVCSEYSKTDTRYNLNNVNATFVQVFE